MGGGTYKYISTNDGGVNEQDLLLPRLIADAGLTEGESKVYLALLHVGPSTTGPIIDRAGVANSIVQRLLNGLVEKGLVSYIVEEKRRRYQAAPPARILDYIEQRKLQLEKSQRAIGELLPQLSALSTALPGSTATIYRGFKGFQTAWELLYQTLTTGDEYHSYGVHAQQDERFHIYWRRDHERRSAAGIKSKILFNQGTDPKVLQNRNSYPGCQARYMPTPIVTPAWFTIWKDTVVIGLQEDEPVAIVIINPLVAQSFDAYFQDLWSRSEPLARKG